MALVLAGSLLLARPCAAAVTISSFSCASSSYSGAGTDACTIAMSGTVQASNGRNVNLSSNSAAVQVPSTVNVPSGSSSVTFSATISAVSSPQTVTITAHTWNSTVTVTLQLSPSGSSGTSGPAWSIASSNVAFGNVAVNTTATQSVQINSTGSQALTINSGTESGAGFSLSGMTFPVTLNPGQSALLNITFAPTAATTYTGSVTLMSNASSGGTATIAVSGTGQASSYSVDLTWSAPSSSSDPVAGYNVYRSSDGGSTYQLLNSSPDANTTYTDSTVQSGASYQYYVESVDAQGNTSGPSNSWSATIP
jgi:hypothetical protein